MKRVAVVCPGRGSYTRSELGMLTEARTGAPGIRADYLTLADRWRDRAGRTRITDLDRAVRFGSEHLAGENAAALIFTVSAVDATGLSEDSEVVAVCGNSMGWYTALHVAGVLDFEDGLRLADTMGSYQADGVIGGQVIVPVIDADWRRDPMIEAAVWGALRTVRSAGLKAWPSIRLGGYEVLAGEQEAVRLLLQVLPKLRIGEKDYPFQLLGHSAFHTPLMAETSVRASADLGGLPWRAPEKSLVDGRGVIWRPRTTDARDLARYTLGSQVVETFDFTASIRVILREFAPEALVLLGPGDSLGGALGQILAAEGWNGIRSKADFAGRQRSPAPVICRASAGASTG